MGMGTRMLKAQGVIRRRLLVNALVDPEEARTRLPAGLRCELLDGFRSARPAPSSLMESVPVSWSAEVGTATAGRGVAA
jgi:hypothetical protein